MAVVIVRPDGVSAGASVFPATGAASGNAATSDDSDASYVRKSTSFAGTQSTIQTFGTTTISATQQVKQVRLRARVQTPTSSGAMDFLLGTRVSGVNYWHSGLTARGLLTTQTITGAWFTSAPDGLAWDQSRIDALRGQVTEYKDTTDRGYVYELYIDVDVANQPSVTVSAPSGTVTTSATPDIGWTYTDTDGDSQSYYEAKVFTAAQYGAAGFSAATSTPTWTSGVVGSVDTGTTIGEPLLNGVHRAYVRVGKSINGQPFWSGWAYSQFTINLTPPPTPTLTANWDSTNGYATLTIAGGTPSGYTSQYFEVYRSDDGGTTYAYIRDGDVVTPSGTSATITDYEAPRDTTVRYRVRSIGVSGENRVPTAYSNVAQVLVTNDGTWWLKCISDPTLSTGSLSVQNALSVKVEEPNTVVRPLGRNLPIVVSGLIGGYDGGLKIIVHSDDEWEGLEPLLTHQGTLLLQDPLPRQKYIRITSRSWDENYSAGRVVREVTLEYVEVDA